QFRAAVMRDPKFEEMWATAKAERPHGIFEEAIDMARKLRDTNWTQQDTNKVRALDVAIKALQVAAGRLSPREYGERPPAQVVVPVQINTSLSLDPNKPKTTQTTVYQIEALSPKTESESA